MSSSSPPSSDGTPLANVLEDIARLRARVPTEDRVALLDAIRKIENDLRALDRSVRFGPPFTGA